MIGFIVERHMEADIIKHLCKSSEIRRLQMNGCDFPIPKICDRIIPHMKMLYRKNLKKIIVIIDREQRNISSEDFENSIRNELISRNIACDDLIITSPDRNFESWIVPFLNESCEPCLEGQAIAEGNNGKSIIKRKFKAIGRTYVETVDGVKLFKMINPTALAGLSDSFRRFTQVFEEECWWFKGAN